MTTVMPSLCLACRRLKEDSTCAAFPEGIPLNIIFYGADHRQPVAGDNGVLFEMSAKPSAPGAFNDWRELHG